MKSSIILLYIFYTIPLVHAAGETLLYFNTPSQVKNSTKMMHFIDGEESDSQSYWGSSACYHSGVPGTHGTGPEGGSCDGLPIYTYFDYWIIKPGQTDRFAIEVPEYRLDCNITGATAEAGADEHAEYRVSWFLGFGLGEGSDPINIVCTNTTTT